MGETSSKMQTNDDHRLIILTGPSCVGKTPLLSALKRYYASILGNIDEAVLYTSRAPRPGEQEGIDYIFRTRAFIENLHKQKKYLVKKIRNDTLAFDLENAKEKLKKKDLLYVGNTFFAELLLAHKALKEVRKKSLFISPVSKEEIGCLRSMHERVDLKEVITGIMRKKLLRRESKQKGLLSLVDLNDIELRAHTAYDELKLAYVFDCIIVNHDGEDSDNWQSFGYPLGDAYRSLLTLVDLLTEKSSFHAEQWTKQLLD
mgnify:CR=1 FL=1